MVSAVPIWLSSTHTELQLLVGMTCTRAPVRRIFVSSRLMSMPPPRGNHYTDASVACLTMNCARAYSSSKVMISGLTIFPRNSSNDR